MFEIMSGDSVKKNFIFAPARAFKGLILKLEVIVLITEIIILKYFRNAIAFSISNILKAVVDFFFIENEYSLRSTE